MKLENKSILITGASGGIGSCLVDELVLRQPKKIYAADLSLEKLRPLQERYGALIVPLKLDVTSSEDIERVGEYCADLDVLINNAGVEFATSFLDQRAPQASSIEMAVNYFGVHQLCHRFWNQLIAKESSAIVNILSVASFSLILKLGTYCASKTAAHLLTQGLRVESQNKNIKVFAVYPGYVDTAMIENMDVAKAKPSDVAANICLGIEKDVLDIFPDKMAEDLSQKIAYLQPILA